MEQIKCLKGNAWIKERDGAWGSHIVLAAKPHQEDVDDIQNFVWRMCVSYRGLNKVTKIYEFTIPRCDMAVTIFENESSKMYIITVDTKKGYHQVTVQECDVEKLVFFAPDHNK